MLSCFGFCVTEIKSFYCEFNYGLLINYNTFLLITWTLWILKRSWKLFNQIKNDIDLINFQQLKFHQQLSLIKSRDSVTHFCLHPPLPPHHKNVPSIGWFNMSMLREGKSREKNEKQKLYWICSLDFRNGIRQAAKFVTYFPLMKINERAY